jgi:2-keto-4-pentenoate hydratase
MKSIERSRPVPERTDTETLARRLDEAWENREPIAPLSGSDGLEDVERAYEIQSRWSEIRISRGERIIGRKIGLTSFAMQEQIGVSEPDYGSLWESRYFPAQGGRTEIPADLLLQPFLEGELAFLIGRPLAGPGVTLQTALAATDALAVAVEVVDSRIEDWDIKLPDTIADNASYGGFTTGPWSRSLRESDLRTIGMLINQNGSQVAEGIGAASLGHPAEAVAWLANKLASFGTSLEPGDIVLSGSLGKAVPVRQGDVFVLEAHGQPPLTVSFA